MMDIDETARVVGVMAAVAVVAWIGVGCAETSEPPAGGAETVDKRSSLEGEAADEFPFERMLEKASEEGAVRAIRGCAEGSAEACYEVGDRYHGGDGVPRDNDLSVEIIDHACDSGYLRACYDMGARYYQGIEVEQRLPLARTYFETTCSEGYPEACHMLARMARDGLGGPRDVGRASRLFDRSCELGFEKDCRRERAPVRSAAVGPREAELPESAPDVVVRAARRCDSGLMSGCTRLARAYESGRALIRDFGRAETLYDLACDWGDVEACVSFRMMQGSLHRFPGLTGIE